jgi:hypothetical protein
MSEQEKQKQEQQQPQEGQPETQNEERRGGDAPTAQNREEMHSASQAPDEKRHADEVTGEGTGARGGEYS